MLPRLPLLLAVGAAVICGQHMPWEANQRNTGANPYPAWYVPKPMGSSSFGAASALGAPAYPHGGASYAAGRTYPPNFPGYPTFPTAPPVGVSTKTGGIPYSFTTTYRPKTTTGLRPKPTGKPLVDKYLPLIKKKKASTTTTVPTTTVRRKKVTVVPTTRRTTTTTRRPTTTTVDEDSEEWESLEIEVVEPSSTTVKPITTKKVTTTQTPKTTLKSTTTTEVIKKQVKELGVKGRPERPSNVFKPISTTEVPLEEEEEEDFSILGYLWMLARSGMAAGAKIGNSELLAAIKDVVKKLKSSIDEAGLEEDVRQVSDHFKNTIKQFAAASPVNEQLGRLFERAQNSDVKLD